MEFGEEEVPYGYTTHNTGGEHAIKHQGDVVTASYLRAIYLGLGQTDEARVDFERMLIDRLHGRDHDNTGEFVFVAEHGDDGLSRARACGYGITKFDQTQKWALKAKVEELVVEPEHRGKGLATWILRTLAMKRLYSDYECPIEMTVDRSVGPDGESFAERLSKDLFKRVDTDGNPVIWLPGNIHMVRGQHHEGMKENMPEGWNGVLEVSPMLGDEDGSAFYEIYRDGALFARTEFTDEQDERGRSQKVATLAETGEQFPVNNRHEMAHVEVLNHPLTVALNS